MTGEGEVSLRAFVHGRVQGVGFRFFVERHAGSLGLTGYTRNLSDGMTVEVVAEGPRQALEALLTELRRGPRMAFVERVDAAWGEPSGQFDGFGIRY
jgi:acylphosphatase